MLMTAAGPWERCTAGIIQRPVIVEESNTLANIVNLRLGSLGFEHLGTGLGPIYFYGPDTAEIEVPYHAYMTSVERP